MRVIPLLASLAVAETSAAQTRLPVSNSVGPGTSAISGVLIDTVTKQPVAGCMVVLNQLYVPRNLHAITKTGDAGEYAFVGIPEAEYHVNTMCDSYLPACYRRDGTTPPRCDPVAVVVDQRKSNLNVALVRGAIARGRVVDARDRPIGGATIRLGMPVRNALWSPSSPSQTKPDGSFELANLPAGEWRLELELPEVAGALRAPTIYFPGVLQAADAGAIGLVAGETLDNIKFVAPRISDNTLTVRVVSSEPTLSRLDVSFVRVEPLVTRPVPIDASLTGTLTGLAPGKYLLAARGMVGNRVLTAHDFVDFLGDEQETLLYMQPAARIAGRIVGEKGAVVPFDGVRVGAAWLQDGVEVNPLNVDQAPVAADGTFHFDGLFGTRRLQVTGVDHEWEIRSIVQDRSDVTTSGVALAAGTEAKVVITLGRR